MVNELNEILKKLDKLQKEAKDTIVKKLDSTSDIDGVKRISDNVVIVSSSKLNINDFSAEYYMSNVQVKYIKEQLSKMSDIRQIKKKIDEYIETKKINIGNNFKINLNSKVLECLEDIQINFTGLE